MRRSLLFIPANSPAMLQNADVFGADGVIFDLEDAVVDSEKDAARILLTHYLNHFPLNINFEVIVRINAFDFPELLKADLDLLPLNKIDTIMLPKANIESINQLDSILKKIEADTKLTKKIAVIPIIELASSLVNVYEIAKASRVNALLLGAEDLSTDMNMARTEKGDEILLARSMVVLASKANGIDAIDTPYTNTQDASGLKSDTLKAKSLGMNAKALIHPNQIDTVNEAFSPKKEEIAYAKEVLKLQEKAFLEGKGAFSYQNKMIDKPIIERAKKVIELAKKWNL